MKKLGEITTGMNDAQVADALSLQLNSSPRVWRKRLARLRNQGRDDEATWIETTFPEYVDERMDELWKQDSDRLAVWFDRVVTDEI